MKNKTKEYIKVFTLYIISIVISSTLSYYLFKSSWLMDLLVIASTGLTIFYVYKKRVILFGELKFSKKLQYKMIEEKEI